MVRNNMDDEKPKKRAICPRCGELNWKPPTCQAKMVLDAFGIKHYVMISKMKYKCVTCKCVWSETWEEDLE